jgi:hypothetical protein
VHADDWSTMDEFRSSTRAPGQLSDAEKQETDGGYRRPGSA